MRKRISLKPFGVFLLAASVGATAALLGVGFQKLLQILQGLFLGNEQGSVAAAGEQLGTWRRLVTPALGGVCAALCLMLVRWKRGPFGLGDMLELAVTRKGTISPFTSLVQIVSSAFSISSGGSVGKEGPNSQLGATMAAVAGRIFTLSARTKTILLGAGVAAGMACAYRAPIAGALLVMEIVLGNFAMDVFAPIVVASVVAVLVFEAILPFGALYKCSQLLEDPRLVLSAALLGVMCGFGGIAFRKSLDLGRVLFARVPIWLALPLGGLGVGAIGIWYPQVWGNGFDVIKMTTSTTEMPTMGLIAALLIWKVVATAISTGSGALGGIFTPNLVVGAVFGWFFGEIVRHLAPGTEDPRPAFAFVGLAGLCAATTHAPISAVLLVLEFTRDYGLVLPVMLCSIVGSVVARLLDEDSVYTARLRAKGHEVNGGVEQLAMQSTYVRDIMRTDAERVGETASFDAVMDVMGRSRRNTIYVVDPRGHLLGHVHIHDVKNFINDPSLSSVVIALDLLQPASPVTPEQSLAQIALRFDDPDLDELPVVLAKEQPILRGRVTRSDLVGRLSSEVLMQRNLRSRWKSDDGREIGTYELPAGSEIVRFLVPEALVGHTVEAVDFGSLGLVPLVVTQAIVDAPDESVIAEPTVKLGAGATLLVLGRKDAIAAFLRSHGL